MRSVVALTLGAIFFLEPLLAVRAEVLAVSQANNQDAQDQPAAKPDALSPAAETLRQRLLDTPSGSTVEVRLFDKKKVRGVLQGEKDDRFILQTRDEQGVQNQEIKFEEVKSVKVQKFKVKRSPGEAGRKVGKALMWVGVGTAAILLMAIIGYAASAD